MGDWFTVCFYLYFLFYSFLPFSPLASTSSLPSLLFFLFMFVFVMFCFKSNHATWSLSFYLSGSFLGFQTCLNFLTDVKKGLEEETIEIHLHSGLISKPPGKEYARRIQMIWPNNKTWVTSSVYHLHTDSILVMFKSIHIYVWSFH